jgi:katanin p60 ATPase-containing subunit A1
MPRRRLEKRIYIPLPGLADRQQLIRLLLRGTQVAADVDLGQVALRLEGFR